MIRKCIRCECPSAERFCQPCISVLNSNTSETGANRQLSETRHRPPQRRSTDRRGWAEAIALGLIVALFLAAMSYGGQWLDSVVAGWVK